MKFYPADWRSDPKLRLCSLAARGLWMEMLALMHEAEPYGHLTISGREMTPRELANLVGIATRTASKLLEELEINGVYSRDKEGIIFSRRMVRDAEKAQKDRENGAKGGNPRLMGGVNPPDKAQKPEARSQKPETKGGRSARVWEGKIISLAQADYDRWRKTYSNIPDFDAALQSADDYYSENPPKGGKWFFPVSRWLEREHQKHAPEEVYGENSW